MTIGQRLRQLRVDAGLSQGEAARRLLCHRNTLCSYETDRIIPPVPVLTYFADSYGVTLDWLIAGTTRQHVQGRVLIGAA